MTVMEIFFYLVLPLGLVASGWIAVRLNERSSRDLHPGE